MFTVMPAVDVVDGCVVRLYQGDPGAVTVYHRDPVAQAAQFVAEGARALHVVDLNAAWGKPGLTEQLVGQLVGLGVPVQLGGGVRSVDAARRWLDVGVARLVVGSVVREAGVLAALVNAVGVERLVVSLDFRVDQLAVDGWRTQVAVDRNAVAEQLRELGMRRVIVTAVARDGTAGGPDLALVALWRRLGFQVMAAGGIRGVADLRALAQAGAEGAVVGRALYEGALTLAEAEGVAVSPC